MKSEQDVAKIFADWFSECNNTEMVRDLLHTIHEAVAQECANRVIDLEQKGKMGIKL